ADDPRSERLVHSRPVAPGDLLSAEVADFRCQQRRDVASIPSWSAGARARPFHDTMQRFAGAPLPFPARHLAKPVDTKRPHAGPLSNEGWAPRTGGPGLR